ncbi:hypothetical protein Nepgr_006445 [Nepenthes gracilis]|uniref:RING-type domain-containing protein n=1 Tax=Nepenthes gracilis TaxID=150966 RepID=A0AAD3XHF1_NEPGR|nr:hypothetical protein Nepgr_006445 [Nepenthes gracilis]
MAGVLPGVESARRRRIHQSSGSPSLAGHGYSRRSSVCRFTSYHETHVISPSSLQRGAVSRAYNDEKLGDLARVAKKRLDERLRAHRKPESRRNNSDVDEETSRIVNARTTIREVQTEVFGSKKSGGSKRFSWAKLGWKPWEQEDCAVCLEEFVVGENLVNLPCAHKFHSRCFLPWLQNNSYCPCCRSAIFSQN